jgi:hypothetical protein
VRPTVAIDNALRAQHNSTLATAFADWTLWNYFTGTRSDSSQYYPEGALYRSVTQQPCTYANAPRSVPDSLPPLSARYLQVYGASQPLTFIAANVDVGSAFAGSTARESFAFLLSPNAADNSYRSTAAGVYIKLENANSSHWWSWDVVNGVVGNQPVDEETPFPNPFLVDGQSQMYVPSLALEGTLSVYTSSMRRVYQGDQTSVMRLGRRVFSWNGKTDNGETAATGIYLYVLSLSDHTVTGKIAVVRK